MANGKTTRILASTAIAGLTVAALAPLANASTSYTWIQQVQRASADAPCDTPAVEGEAAGWSDWGPSWAHWPHEGQGGWVCTRSITWAHSSASRSSTPDDSGDSGASCITGFNGTNFWDFTGVDWLPIGTQIYSDATCTTPLVDPGFDTAKSVIVLADDVAAAKAICDRVGAVYDGTPNLADNRPPADQRLFYCD